MKLAALSFAEVLGASAAVAVPLDPAQSPGKSLFFDTDLSVNGNQACATCHGPDQGFSSPVSDIYAADSVAEGSVPGRFDNLGVPKNPDVPWYTQAAFNPDGKACVDPGLGGMLKGDATYAANAADLMGAQKVPTLRNISKRITPDVVRSCMHNGYFKTLDDQ